MLMLITGSFGQWGIVGRPCWLKSTPKVAQIHLLDCWSVGLIRDAADVGLCVQYRCTTETVVMFACKSRNTATVPLVMLMAPVLDE